MSSKFIALTSALALSAGTVLAGEMHFNSIATFPVVRNMADGADQSRESSAEIIDATGDGMTLVYTDSPLGVLGLVDIADPANPQPKGNIALGGEPTSVAVVGSMAIVAVNTSESYVSPSGHVVAIDTTTGTEVGRCDLGRQPDSVAKAKDGSFVAIAIENERDEDLEGGALPQMPAGYLVTVGLTGDGSLDCGTLKKVEGLAILPSGEGFVVTDNDGVDDSSGETMVFSIGQM